MTTSAIRAVALGLTLLATQAAAIEANGITMVQDCAGAAGAPRAFCAGMIFGAVAAWKQAQDYYGGRAGRICTPDGWTSFQALAIANKWMADHPEYLHYPMDTIALASHNEAFPCR